MFVNKLIVLCLLSFLSACATPYFGYSETEWNKLSEPEQEVIKSDHQAIIASRATIKHQDTIDGFQDTIVKRGRGVRGPDSFD